MKKKTLTDRFYNKEELTVAERKEIHAGDIRLNRIKCNKCNDVITSDNRHHFKYCKCGNCAVDGGSWYARRLGEDYTEMMEEYNEKEND